LIKGTLAAIGVAEDEFQEMVDQGFVRLEDPTTGEQYPMVRAPVMDWPANILIWPMKESPEGETTPPPVISGSFFAAFTWGVAFLPIFVAYAM
jgi:hypothetical protein